MADVLLKDITGKDTPYEGVETVSLRSTDGGTETFVSERLIQKQEQADWAETDTTSPAYIKNKPLPEVEPIEQAQVDWNENDENSVSYIKNRPFGTIVAGTVVSEGVVNCDEPLGEGWEEHYASVDEFEIVNNMTYAIEFDGTVYEVVAQNSAIYYDNDGVYFAFVNGAFPGATALLSLQGEHMYKVALDEDIIEKIDSIYLPDDIGGVPESTASDAGKVLTVDAYGMAIWETPGLPDVTTAENGAFLRIVNGVPAWVTIPSGEEATF